MSWIRKPRLSESTSKSYGKWKVATHFKECMPNVIKNHRLLLKYDSKWYTMVTNKSKDGHPGWYIPKRLDAASTSSLCGMVYQFGNGLICFSSPLVRDVIRMPNYHGCHRWNLKALSIAEIVFATNAFTLFCNNGFPGSRLQPLRGDRLPPPTRRRHWIEPRAELLRLQKKTFVEEWTPCNARSTPVQTGLTSNFAAATSTSRSWPTHTCCFINFFRLIKLLSFSQPFLSFNFLR